MKIQFDLPQDVNRELALYSIRENLNDKRKSIIKILREKFNLKEPVKLD